MAFHVDGYLVLQRIKGIGGFRTSQTRQFSSPLLHSPPSGTQHMSIRRKVGASRLKMRMVPSACQEFPGPLQCTQLAGTRSSPMFLPLSRHMQVDGRLQSPTDVRVLRCPSWQSEGGWRRDLTAEGIEPNPGPQRRLLAEVRRLYLWCLNVASTVRAWEVLEGGASDHVGAIALQKSN